MSPPDTTDEAWAQRILDRLRVELWSAQESSMFKHITKERVEAILKKLRDELWPHGTEPEDRTAWAENIIDRLRKELWSPAGTKKSKKLSTDEEKRIDAILARLKQDLWNT